MATVSAEFPAMGSTARVVVVDDDEDRSTALVDVARRRIEDLERRWSRFVATSELCRLNASGGGAEVSDETAAVIRLAVDAWRRTGGLFDPTVLAALEGAGYDRPFDVIGAGEPGRPTSSTAVLPGGQAGPVPGCDGISVEPGGRVHLPRGLRLDLGGIGKGRSADLVATELLTAGAAGACVDLGGDVRVVGRPPSPAGWAVALEGPDGGLLGVVDLADGAVATSSVGRRRWSGPTGPAHHLIDPATGRPAQSDVRSVSVVAAGAAWAEIFAKAALVAGVAGGVALLARAGLAAVLVTDDEQVLTAGDIDRFLRPPVADRLEELDLCAM